MSEQQGNIDDLIGNLTDELSPVKPMAHPLVRLMPMLAVALAYIGFISYQVGLRNDISSISDNMYFVWEVGLGGLIAFFAAMTSAFLCVPDMRGQKWLIPVSLTLFGVLLAWTMMRGMTEGFSAEHAYYWSDCFYDGAIMGFVPTIVVVLFSLRGKTTRPVTMAAMNVLAITGLGYIGLRFTCAMDHVEHAFLFHLVPFAVLAFLIGVLAQRLYKW